MSNLLVRLREEIRGLGGPLKVSRLLEVAKGTIYNWMEKGNIPADKLVVLAEQGADVAYILSGQRSAPAGVSELRPAYGELIFVPRYEARAGSGKTGRGDDENLTHTFAYRRDWLADKGLKAENLAVMSTQGDSMSNLLEDGDLVLFDAADVEIRSGKAYVVRVDDELVVKYVQRLPGDKLQLSSENTRYPPFTIEGSENLSIVGRVVFSTREW